MASSLSPLPATLSLADASARLWNVVVIGAGPAGALAARESAKAGLSVLLVERQTMPRAKVCGGCLNHGAVAALRRAGLWSVVDGCDGRPVSALNVFHEGRHASIRIPEGLAVTRSRLDWMLVSAAIGSGAHFMPETTAAIVLDGPKGFAFDRRRVELAPRHGEAASIEARVVVVSDGLGPRGVDRSIGVERIVSAASRVGAGAISDAGMVAAEPGTITMAVDRAGYVGLVRTEGDTVTLAAAIDAEFMRQCGSAGGSALAILERAGFVANPAVEGLEWRGTLPLTQRLTRPVGRRVFVVGDAAAYVEPFTGEGMAWAIASGLRLGAFVERGQREWTALLENAWVSDFGSVVGRRLRTCRAVARGLRSPALVRAVVAVAGRWPGFSRPIVRRLTS